MSRQSQNSRISELAKSARPTVKVIGLGGAGCNIVSWIAQNGVDGIKTIAADTDAVHLLTAKSDVRILMGEKAYMGRVDAEVIQNAAQRQPGRASMK